MTLLAKGVAAFSNSPRASFFVWHLVDMAGWSKCNAAMSYTVRHHKQRHTDGEQKLVVAETCSNTWNTSSQKSGDDEQVVQWWGGVSSWVMPLTAIRSSVVTQSVNNVAHAKTHEYQYTRISIQNCSGKTTIMTPSSRYKIGSTAKTTGYLNLRVGGCSYEWTPRSIGSISN